MGSRSGSSSDKALKGCLKTPSETEQLVSTLQTYRLLQQKKSFTAWVNSQLRGSFYVRDLFEDLRDGHILRVLLEIVSGEHLPKLDVTEKELKIHHVQNVSICLKYLATKVRLENIGPVDIVDGSPDLTLGLIYSIMHRFAIQVVVKTLRAESMRRNPKEQQRYKDAETGDLDFETGRRILLDTVRDRVAGYKGVNILDFDRSWQDGLAFNALLHSRRPDLFDFYKIDARYAEYNLRQAFDLAEKYFGVPRLLEPLDVLKCPDEKCIEIYVTELLRRDFISGNEPGIYPRIPSSEKVKDEGRVRFKEDESKKKIDESTSAKKEAIERKSREPGRIYEEKKYMPSPSVKRDVIEDNSKIQKKETSFSEEFMQNDSYTKESGSSSDFYLDANKVRENRMGEYERENKYESELKDMYDYKTSNPVKEQTKHLESSIKNQSSYRDNPYGGFSYHKGTSSEKLSVEEEKSKVNIRGRNEPMKVQEESQIQTGSAEKKYATSSSSSGSSAMHVPTRPQPKADASVKVESKYISTDSAYKPRYRSERELKFHPKTPQPQPKVVHHFESERREDSFSEYNDKYQSKDTLERKKYEEKESQEKIIVQERKPPQEKKEYQERREFQDKSESREMRGYEERKGSFERKDYQERKEPREKMEHRDRKESQERKHYQERDSTKEYQERKDSLERRHYNDRKSSQGRNVSQEMTTSQMNFDPRDRYIKIKGREGMEYKVEAYNSDSEEIYSSVPDGSVISYGDHHSVEFKDEFGFQERGSDFHHWPQHREDFSVHSHGMGGTSFFQHHHEDNHVTPIHNDDWFQFQRSRIFHDGATSNWNVSRFVSMGHDGNPKEFHRELYEVSRPK